jgi:hypothetical protein
MVCLCSIGIFFLKTYLMRKTKDIFRGLRANDRPLDPMIISSDIIQFLSIQLLGWLFKHIAVRLVNWQNHKFVDEHQRELIKLRCIFNMVNFYSQIIMLTYFLSANLDVCVIPCDAMIASSYSTLTMLTLGFKSIKAIYDFIKIRTRVYLQRQEIGKKRAKTSSEQLFTDESQAPLHQSQIVKECLLRQSKLYRRIDERIEEEIKLKSFNEDENESINAYMQVKLAHAAHDEFCTHIPVQSSLSNDLCSCLSVRLLADDNIEAGTDVTVEAAAPLLFDQPL